VQLVAAAQAVATGGRADIIVCVGTRRAVLFRYMVLVAVTGAITACCGTLVGGVRARLAVRRYMRLVARSQTVAAGFCADITVGVRTRRAVGLGHVQLIAVAGTVATRCGALVAGVVARLAIRQYVGLVARALTVATRFCALIAVGVSTRRAVGRRYVRRIADAIAVATCCSTLVAASAARRAVRRYVALVARA
jgi:hypothetical protein